MGKKDTKISDFNLQDTQTLSAGFFILFDDDI